MSCCGWRPKERSPALAPGPFSFHIWLSYLPYYYSFHRWRTRARRWRIVRSCGVGLGPLHKLTDRDAQTDARTYSGGEELGCSRWSFTRITRQDRYRYAIHERCGASHTDGPNVGKQCAH